MHFEKAEAPPRSTAEQHRTGFVKEGPGLDRSGREEEMGGRGGKETLPAQSQERCWPRSRQETGNESTRRFHCTPNSSGKAPTL